jgi:hypothetical protein
MGELEHGLVGRGRGLLVWVPRHGRSTGGANSRTRWGKHGGGNVYLSTEIVRIDDG